MGKIVEVQISKYGKVQFFDCGDLVLERGDPVLVQTEMGPALGVVCTGPRHALRDPGDRPLPRVQRLANMQDLEIYEHHRRLEAEIYGFCYEKVRERSLPMSLVSVDRMFDGSKVMVFFTSEGRVDFRDLVKDLVQRFRTRIEMRQIGVRHQAKMVGGLGNCGRQLCCTSFLTNFDPVSIKMAKEQNLSLNPSKISGMCGRLMCCLSYEYGYYEEAKKGVPKVGKKVRTVHGEGKIIRQNVLMRRLTVLLESGEEQEISYDDIVREGQPQGAPRGPEKKPEDGGRKTPQKGAPQKPAGQARSGPGARDRERGGRRHPGRNGGHSERSSQGAPAQRPGGQGGGGRSRRPPHGEGPRRPSGQAGAPAEDESRKSRQKVEGSTTGDRSQKRDE